MNKDNLEYLKDRLLNLGFGDKANDELEKQIKKQGDDFSLKIELPQYKDKSVDYELHFKKSDKSDMYFFNSYDAHLKAPDPDHDKKQRFYVNEGNTLTAKEAFNLLEGRSVHKNNLLTKDGVKYDAWLQLDLTNPDSKTNNYSVQQYHHNYGYNLEKTLDKFPIKELNDPAQKEKLVASLEKGNSQMVTIEVEKKETKFYIEANPKFKTINVHDQTLNPVKRETLQKAVETGQAKAIKTGQVKKTKVEKEESKGMKI